MTEYQRHERLIAKIQHFAEWLKQSQIEREILLISTPGKNCQKEKIQESILVYEEMLKEYYDIFEDIVHR